MLLSYQLYFNIILNYFILFARRRRYALTKLKLFAIRFHPLYPVGISTVINPYSTLVSTVPSWYKYCNQPVLYTGKYCTVGTSTVINPFSKLVSNKPSWYKYCNQPVLYTGKYCTVGTSTVINPYSTLVSTVQLVQVL